MYRIFIVEDDEIIANLLKKNLCSWGYDVSCAEDFSNNCLFITVFTGVRRFVGFPRYRSSLFPLHLTI